MEFGIRGEESGGFVLEWILFRLPFSLCSLQRIGLLMMSLFDWFDFFQDEPMYARLVPAFTG